MFNHYFTLRFAARRLDAELRGSVIRAIFTQEKNEAIFHCRNERESCFLLFSCDGRMFHATRRKAFHRAKKNSLDLFPALLDTAIEQIAIDSSDRVIRIHLSNGLRLAASLLPGRPNLFLLDPEGNVLDRFKSHPLSLDPPRDASNTDPGRAEIRRRLAARGEEPFDLLLRSLFPTLGGTLRKELLHRSGILADETSSGVLERRFDALIAAHQSLVEDLAHPIARVYFDGEEAALFSIIPLAQAAHLAERIYDDPFEAIDRFVRSSARRRQFVERKKLLAAILQKEEASLRRALEAMESTEALVEHAAQYDRRASLLMTVLAEERPLPDKILVPDLFEEEGRIAEIPLMPDLSLLENAQRYYRKSRQCREAVRHTESRFRKKGARLAEVERARRELERCFDYSSLKKYITGNAAMLTSLGIDDKSEEKRKPFPYRRFVVFGGYEVWAGKSGANNDELTVHGADKNDYWFHSRGVGGSHVVLKTGGQPDDVPKEAILAAASIAAYYSKQRKAKAVAVSYTLKKYVRKPKGVPVGTVYIEREKVVLVPPKLPEQQESNDQ